jgi:LytR_cpsA_psr family/LytR cell envelope-related transcriptional attenuator
VDALGGVNICIDRPMYDRLAGLDLPAGCHDLDGKQALGFVRARHLEGDCIPDFSRIARQQQFLRAVLSEVLSPSTVFRLPSLIRAVVANLPHDRSLELQELVDLTADLQGLETGAVEFRAVPGEPGWARNHTVSVVRMKPQARELFRRLREGGPLGSVGKQLPGTQISPANVRVRVIDDGSGGTAEEVRAFLARAGFETLRLSTALPDDGGGTEILFRVGREDSARAVQRFLPSFERREVPSNLLPRADVAVVVPAGYAGPGEGGAVPPTQPPPDEPAPC